MFGMSSGVSKRGVSGFPGKDAKRGKRVARPIITGGKAANARVTPKF
jgi:hypothetical protein